MMRQLLDQDEDVGGMAQLGETSRSLQVLALDLAVCLEFFQTTTRTLEE